MADRGPAPPETLPGLKAAVRAAGRPRRTPQVEPVTDVDPVARVLVETPLAHLDRPFDYAVPASMADSAVPGARVKVRFAGKDLDGFVVARAASSEHTGTLTPLRRVVSPEPVLLPAVADLAGVLAERYAGTRADVLRLAVPARHATTEARESPPEEPIEVDPEPLRRAWSGYPAADAYLAHLATGGSPRAVWSALPGDDWPRLLATAAAATLASGRGSVLVVPDHRDLARVDAALTDVLGAGHHVVLTAGAGPARRYREFLAVSRGTRRIVVGTRAAAFAPVHDLGLVAIWDDGDDLHAEPRAPYPHAREVLLSRALLEGAGGAGRRLLPQRRGRAARRHRLGPRDRAAARGRAGRGDGLGDRRHRRPARARPAGAGVADAASGPRRDRRRARARAGAAADPATRLRAVAGLRALPYAGPVRRLHRPAGGRRRSEPAGLSLVRHGRGGVGVSASAATGASAHRWWGSAVPPRRSVGPSPRRRWWPPVATTSSPLSVPRPAVVVATPGAEPVAEGGYATVVLLDTWLALARPDLRTEEEALRRWLGAAGLAAPGAAVVAVGDPAQPVVQALVRWDPAGFARREAESRAEAHLPPASRLATITGDAGAVDDALTLLDRPVGCEVLGPVPVDDEPGAGGGAGAARPGGRPVPRAGRGPAGAVGPQARPGADPGRPDDHRLSATSRALSGSPTGSGRRRGRRSATGRPRPAGGRGSAPAPRGRPGTYQVLPVLRA